MKRVEIDDFAKIRKLAGLTLSPSGKKAAFTVTEGDVEGNRYRTDIWVYDEGHDPALFRLTAGEDGKSPSFEDEDHVIFPADRKKKYADAVIPHTVYNRISLRGGEAEEYLDLPFAAGDLKKIAEDVFLVLGTADVTLPDMDAMSAEERDAFAKKQKEEKDYDVFDELPFWVNGRGTVNKQRTGLYRIAGKEKNRLTPEYFNTHGYALNEAKTKAVYWGTEYVSLNTQKSALKLLDLETLEAVDLIEKDRYSVDFAVFSGENILFAASTGEKYGTSENPVFYLSDGKTYRVLSAPDPSIGPVGSDIAAASSSVSGKDGLYYLRTCGYHTRYCHVAEDGNETVLADDQDLNIISCARGTDVIFMTGMEKSRAQEFYRKENGVTVKLSSFNAEYHAEHVIAEPEHFTFTDSDGAEIDGWILYPADFEKGGSYPAILDVHGGPQTAYGEGFFHEMQYWAAEGYIVFFCNPRGSSGKGGAFADIYGDNYGVRDYNDLMEFTDEVLKRVPEIDVKRIGMTGGSYGGFMANWIIGHTDRFAAVASQRSISNYISKCLTTDIGYYHNLSAIQADPWTNPEKMWKHSPLAYADKAVTPTLFIQSDEDYRCWMGDAVQMLQALLMHGVPARMCLFHGENHELSRSGKPKHRIRRLREITDWFDRYLKGSAD